MPIVAKMPTGPCAVELMWKKELAVLDRRSVKPSVQVAPDSSPS